MHSLYFTKHAIDRKSICASERIVLTGSLYVQRKQTEDSTSYMSCLHNLHVLLLAQAQNLARGARGNSLTLGRGLSTSDLVVGPGPVLAAGAKDVDISSAGLDSSSDLVDGDVGDGDTRSGGTSGRAVLVILLNDDTVLGDVGESDGVVLDIGNGTGSARNGLDADTVVGVGNGRVEDADCLDGVVRASTNGSNGKTVTTTAVAASEGDVGARVDGKTIVLVLDDGSRDIHAGGGANVEGIGVVSTERIAERVVHVNPVDAQVGDAVDAESLDRGVENVQVLDVGVLEGVGAEELGLRLAAVAALAIPPSLTFAVDGVSGSSLDEQVVTGEGDERALPLGIAESGLALEDDVSAIIEFGQVESGLCRNGNVVENDGRAASLVLNGSSRIGESAASTRLKRGCEYRGDQAAEEDS